MNKCHENINWHNDTTPAINETNLNYMDGCIDTVDDRIVSFDTTKANQSDLLQSVKNVTYNTTTGVITVIWWNGNTFTIDLNIEKIPVSFSMSETGVITMTTADGTEYTADISTVLKLYTFVDSDEIDFTVVQNGNNYTVTASIVEGSITADKLQPNFLADCQAAANTASGAATASNASRLESEGWATGSREGVQITDPTSPYYHNNAKYYSDRAGGTSLSGLTDTNIINPTNSQALVYDSDSEKWINGNPTLSKSDVGLGNVDNTSDLDKPISTATQTALNAKITKVTLPVANDLASFNSDGSIKDSGIASLHVITGTPNYTNVSFTETVLSSKTLSDVVKAKEDIGLGISALRNAYATTTDLTAGTSQLAAGTICLVYES